MHLLSISTAKQLIDIYTKALSPQYLFQIGSHQYFLPNLLGQQKIWIQSF